MSTNEDIFEFRDFSMRQAPSGQRINTDSCSFAALIGDGQTPLRILDIGAGTGVVSLMLAVRFPTAKIVAIEPEPAIAAVLSENLAQSPWHERFEVHQCTVQDFNESVHGRFDFVACNPPYFHNSMLSVDLQRQVARHTTSLAPVDLYDAFVRLLSPNGTAWLSCPAPALESWISWGGEAGLSSHELVLLCDHPGASAHVAILAWSLSIPQQKLPPRFCEPRKIFYRDGPSGSQSPWMRQFRETWYPARYNRPS